MQLFLLVHLQSFCSVLFIQEFLTDYNLCIVFYYILLDFFVCPKYFTTKYFNMFMYTVIFLFYFFVFFVLLFQWYNIYIQISTLTKMSYCRIWLFYYMIFVLFYSKIEMLFVNAQISVQFYLRLFKNLSLIFQYVFSFCSYTFF